VSLSEAEWQAFIARHPQPVDWLREQILGQLEGVAGVSREQRGARSEVPARPWSNRRV
jgi:hypothetical protein